MNAPALIDPKCYELVEYFLPSEALSAEIASAALEAAP
jgi:hypothetical protein